MITITGDGQFRHRDLFHLLGDLQCAISARFRRGLDVDKQVSEILFAEGRPRAAA